MKLFMVLALLAILVCLGTALYFMLRHGRDHKGQGRRMANALAWRVGLSIALFLCILLAWQFGYIQPTGLPATAR